MSKKEDKLEVVHPGLFIRAILTLLKSVAVIM